MRSESPTNRSQMMLSFHRDSAGQRQLDCFKKQESTAHDEQRRFNFRRFRDQDSKLLIQRSKNSLKRIVLEGSSEELRESFSKGDSLASLGISFNLLGIDDDMNEDFGFDSAKPLPVPARVESDTSASIACFLQEARPLPEPDESAADHHDNHLEDLSTPQVEMIEVAPGYSLPLRSSEEAWQAILEGRTIRTRCFLCQQTLECIEDAELLACSDCWVFSPIESCNTRRGSYGVCIGTSTADIQLWLAEANQCAVGK